MFEEPISLSRHVRRRPDQLLSEPVGTCIAAPYWFTASTAFPNPAVTLARALSDTLVGIRRADVPDFVGAKALGGTAGALVVHWLVRGGR